MIVDPPSMLDAQRPSPPEPTRARAGGLLFAFALFVATRAAIYLYLQPAYSDVEIYFRYAVQAVDYGRTPYRDFAIEYPPIAYWAMLAPRLVQADRLPSKPSREAVADSYAEYHRLFRLQSLACDVAAFCLFAAIVRRRRSSRAGLLCGCYVLATAILGHLLLDRLDAGLLLLLMAWAYCWLRGLDDDPRSTPWRIASFAFLGVGVSFKLLPILLCPYLILAEWRSRRGGRCATWATLVLALTAAAPFAWHASSAGADVLKFLSYHGERGMQVESIGASLLMALATYGWPIEAVYSHGGWNLAGPAVELMQRAASAALLAVLAAFGVWAMRQGKHFDRLAAYRICCLVLPAAVVCSKVLSPQYLLWVLPLLLLASIEKLPDGRGLAVFAIATVCIAVLTTWLFPYHYFSHLPANLETPAIDSKGLIPALSGAACLVLATRNLLLAASTIWVASRRTAAANR